MPRRHHGIPAFAENSYWCNNNNIRHPMHSIALPGRLPIYWHLGVYGSHPLHTEATSRTE